MRKVGIAIAVLAVAIVLLAMTGPHAWIGRAWCTVRGGEWTRSHESGFDEVVTGGHVCVRE